MLCLVAGFTLWLVTRSWFITGRLEPLVGKWLGGEVEIGHAAYHTDGRFVFQDVRLRVPEQAGLGGEVLKVERAELRIDMSALARGRVELLHVTLDDLLVRMSEDAKRYGVFSFMSLEPELPDHGSAERMPPRVELHKARVEVGLHNGEHYEKKGERVFSGSMKPSPGGSGDDGWFDLLLTEVDEHGQVAGDGHLVVDGQWNALTDAYKLNLRGVRLDADAATVCPELALAWWDAMDPSGEVESVRLISSGGRDFEVRLDVRDMTMLLPVATQQVRWALYRAGRIEPTDDQPRMRVDDGMIRLTRESLTLQSLRGKVTSEAAGAGVVGVPYEITVDITDVPVLDFTSNDEWWAHVRDTVPFTLRLQANRFRARATESVPTPAVLLPMPVAQALERFQLNDWLLSTEIRITRDPPTIASDGSAVAQDIETRGQVIIDDATGAYEKFAYQLTEIEARIEFEGDHVTVDYLRGKGSGDAYVHVSGTIAAVGREAEVDLAVSAAAVPLDNRLRGALDEGQRKIFDALLHHESWEALRSAGLLVNDEDIRRLEAHRDEILAQRRTIRRRLDAGESELADRLAELDAETRRVQRRLEAGAFDLGGTVDLDLRITRPRGLDQRSFTTGTITVGSVGMIYDRFPYPLYIHGGSIEWERDGLRLLAAGETDGLNVITPGGGVGQLSGVIRFDRSSGRIRSRPDLTLSVRDDRTNDLLFAAIPPTDNVEDNEDAAGTWPGGRFAEGAQWLRDLSFVGRLHYTAHFTRDDSGQLDYRVDLDLFEVRMQPEPAIADALGGEGLLQPEDWRLEDCIGRVSIDRESVRLERLTGRHRHGLVSIDGGIDLLHQPLRLSLDVRLQDTELGDYLVNLLPAAQVDRARALWARYQPRGMFDAALTYRRVGERVEPPRLEVIPGDVAIDVDGRSLRFEPQAGGLIVTPTSVRFDTLSIGVNQHGTSSGVITLDGSYGFMADGEDTFNVTGVWKKGRLESPLIAEVLRRFGATRQAEEVIALNPRGSFNAGFSYASANGDAPADYELTLEPTDFAIELRGTPISAQLESGSTLRFTPGRLDVLDVRGTHAGGGFEVGGRVSTTRPVRANLHLGYHGRLTSPQVAAFLPAEVESLFAALDLQEGQPSTLERGRLQLMQVDHDEDGPFRWAVDFDGRFEVADVAFEGGIRFSELSGRIDVDVSTYPDVVPRVEVICRPRSVRALGQHLEDAEATLLLDDEGRNVLLRDLRAEAGEGRVAADGAIGVGDNRAYRVSARLAAVPLSDFIVQSLTPDDEDSSAPARPKPTGELFGRLDLRGQRGEPGARVGRGVGRVIHGELAGIPLALQIMQLTQLTLPVDGLNYAETEFYLVGDRVYLERVLLENTLRDNALLQIEGAGTLDLASFELDARFRSRSGVAVVRDVVGGIGDRLAAIRVTGPLWDPEASVMPLPSSEAKRTVPPRPSPLTSQRDERR